MFFFLKKCVFVALRLNFISLMSLGKESKATFNQSSSCCENFLITCIKLKRRDNLIFFKTLCRYCLDFKKRDINKYTQKKLDDIKYIKTNKIEIIIETVHGIPTDSCFFHRNIQSKKWGCRRNRNTKPVWKSLQNCGHEDVSYCLVEHCVTHSDQQHNCL